MINDKVFGELEFDYVWSKDMSIEFLGKEVDVALTVDGGKDGVFSEKQYASFNSFIDNWEQIQQSILQPILDYYIAKRHELGYDVEFNENYPLIETTEQLIEKINLVGISVPTAKRFEGRYIGVAFDCSWDDENGLGILLVDEKINKVGYQDVTM